MNQIHLVKLCVGAESVADLLAWEGVRGDISTIHTRNMPKRAVELLEGGSLYWVIKGVILCRRRIVSIEPVKNSPVPLVHIGLSTVHYPTESQPRRPFQGWRYLNASDAPRDRTHVQGQDLPEEMIDAIKLAGAW